MTSSSTPTSLAARAGRWSAQHRKIAIFGWLAFVVLSLVIGSAIGVKAPEDDTTFVGDSGKAHQLVEEHFPTENVESILIKGADAGAVRAAADQTVAAVSKHKDVFDVQSPYAKGNEGQIAEDGSVLVNFKLRGDETAADDAAGVADDLASAQAEAGQYLDHLRRLQAEFDNYRKRVVKEQTELSELGAMPVARRLLEVLDDFELALMSADDKPDFERFLKGVELVYAKLLDALKAEGLERIHAEGSPFDPELHEALMQTGDGDGEPVVADVLRPGYTLKGRVLRPAGVRVERP